MYLILLGKTDMFIPVDFCHGPIECKTQVVGQIAAAFGEPDGWLAVLFADVVSVGPRVALT